MVGNHRMTICAILCLQTSPDSFLRIKKLMIFTGFFDAYLQEIYWNANDIFWRKLLLQSFYVFGFHENLGYSYIDISSYRSLPYVHRIYKHHKNRRMKTHEFQAYFRVIFKTAPKRDMHRISCLFSHRKLRLPNPWIIKSNLDNLTPNLTVNTNLYRRKFQPSIEPPFGHCSLALSKIHPDVASEWPEKPLLTCRPLARCNSARGTSKIQCESLFCCMWKRARAAHFERII